MSKNCVKRLFHKVECKVPEGIDETGGLKYYIQKIFDYQIINWDKINIYKFWGGLFFTICHPIYSWKYEKDCYGSFPWKVREFFTNIMWKYMPFSKASRWLGHTLVQRTYDSKYIDWNWANCYGKNKAYLAKCGFGYVHVYAKSNLSKSIKTIYKGWVFTKKKAMRVLKEVILANPKVYNPDGTSYPEVCNSYYMTYTDDMMNLLMTGKVKERAYLDQTYLSIKFKESKDNICKLWCYVTDLMCCRNDFEAHTLLSDIVSKCDMYLYYQQAKIDPTIDYTYNLTLRNRGPKEAAKWINSQIRYYNKKRITKELIKHIQDLRDFYMNQQFEYYRV